jgi:NAD(P)-dependent dehydrogenase (short-subunit alcohol dehydrogenase family)
LTGIGRAAAIAFAKKGAKVVVAGRRDDAGEALVKELRGFGSEAEFIKADVRKENDVRTLIDKTVARFGRLDGWDHNRNGATIAATKGVPPSRRSEPWQENVAGLARSDHRTVALPPSADSGHDVGFTKRGQAVAAGLRRCEPTADAG